METYRWSNASAHLTGGKNDLLSHPFWLDLSDANAYAEFTLEENDESEKALRRATMTGPSLRLRNIYRQDGSSPESAVKTAQGRKPPKKRGVYLKIKFGREGYSILIRNFLISATIHAIIRYNINT